MAAGKMLHHTRTLQLDEMQHSTVLDKEDPPCWSMRPYFATRGEEISQSALDGTARALEEKYWGESLWFLLMTLCGCTADLRKKVLLEACVLCSTDINKELQDRECEHHLCPLLCDLKEH